MSILNRIAEKRGGHTVYELSFDSYGQWVEASRAFRPNAYAQMGTKSFTGTCSFDEAIKLASFGWPEGLKKIREIEAELNKGVSRETYKDEVASDVAGEWYDMSDVVAGVPDCARNMHKVVAEREGKIVDVVCSVSVSCAVDTGVMITKGAAVCALVDALEAAGYRCNVVMVSATEHGYGVKSTHQFTVPVKQADHPLDLENMVFALAHPSTFRRLMFSLMEQQDARWKTSLSIDGNYGRPCSHTMEAVVESQGGVVVGHAGSWQGWTGSVDSARKWVNQQLAKYITPEGA